MYLQEVKEGYCMKLWHKILIATLAVSVVVNVGLGHMLNKGNMSGMYKTNSISNVYEQSLESLCARCWDIEQDFAKLNVTDQSQQRIKILSDIIDDAGAASVSVASLPLYPEYTAVLNRYLNHVSDYSKYLLYSCAGGEDMSDECRKNIDALYKCVQKVNDELAMLGDQLKQTPMDWEKYMNAKLTETDMLDSIMSLSIESLQTQSIDYPTLIYDGPFSDAVVNKEIKEDTTKQVTQGEAINILKEFIKGDGRSYAVTDTQKCNGLIDTWCITLNSGDYYCYGNVSVNSGKVISFINNGKSCEQNISRNEAIDIASEFLENNGYISMEAQYCEVTNGNATVNFVYKQNDTLIYPDMVKVRVDMCDGVVNGFEGMSYYANHKTNRNIDMPESDINEIEELLPKNAEVKRASVAIILDDGENELLCYEYRCRIGEDTYILYYDTKTQKQVKIFKIISTENGDFVV